MQIIEEDSALCDDNTLLGVDLKSELGIRGGDCYERV